MNLLELFKTALRGLSSNKSRTALTMLGIVIGIASVISMLSIGNGAQASVQSSINSLGSNLLTISPGAQQTGVVRAGAGSAQSLTLEDYNSVTNSTDKSLMNAISPEIARFAQIVASGNNTNTRVTGALPDYLLSHNYQMDSGTFITTYQNVIRSRVAVIGPTTATNLFGSSSAALGQTMKINKIIFKVIGVTLTKGSTGFFNQDDFVLVPLSTAQKILFGSDYLTSISIQTSDSSTLSQVQADLNALLLSRHKILDPVNADFTITNSADILSTFSTITSTFTLLLASIAGISLLVGGIGIMNIMIVTVTERTKEIGLRKAIGATNKVILLQFLIESMILTLIGGLIGVLLGSLISSAIGSIGKIPIVVTPVSVILSVSVSVIVGVIFGLYPALKASRLKPIEALRFE